MLLHGSNTKLTMGKAWALTESRVLGRSGMSSRSLCGPPASPPHLLSVVAHAKRAAGDADSGSKDRGKAGRPGKGPADPQELLQLDPSQAPILEVGAPSKKPARPLERSSYRRPKRSTEEFKAAREEEEKALEEWNKIQRRRAASKAAARAAAGLPAGERPPVVIVDAYNVIHRDATLKGMLKSGRVEQMKAELTRRADAHARANGHLCILVYDAMGMSTESKALYRKVTATTQEVLATKSEADTYIVKTAWRLKAQGAPSVGVVTGDRRILDEVMDVPEFIIYGVDADGYVANLQEAVTKTALRSLDQMESGAVLDRKLLPASWGGSRTGGSGECQISSWDLQAGSANLDDSVCDSRDLEEQLRDIVDKLKDEGAVQGLRQRLAEAAWTMSENDVVSSRWSKYFLTDTISDAEDEGEDGEEEDEGPGQGAEEGGAAGSAVGGPVQQHAGQVAAATQASIDQGLQGAREAAGTLGSGPTLGGAGREAPPAPPPPQAVAGPGPAPVSATERLNALKSKSLRKRA